MRLQIYDIPLLSLQAGMQSVATLPGQAPWLPMGDTVYMYTHKNLTKKPAGHWKIGGSEKTCRKAAIHFYIVIPTRVKRQPVRMTIYVSQWPCHIYMTVSGPTLTWKLVTLNIHLYDSHWTRAICAYKRVSDPMQITFSYLVHRNIDGCLSVYQCIPTIKKMSVGLACAKH